jgi:hypothetical protein
MRAHVDMIAPAISAALANGRPVRRQQLTAPHDSCTLKKAQDDRPDRLRHKLREHYERNAEENSVEP